MHACRSTLEDPTEAGTPHRAVVASIPLTALMVVYTVISLLVIAEPLVQFGASSAPP